MFVHNGWWWTLISSDESSVMDGNWVLLCECNNTCGVLMEWGCLHISFLSSFMWILLSLAGSAPSPAQAESGRGWEEAGSGVRVASASVMRSEDISYNPASGDTGDTVSVLASEGGNLVWLCFNVYDIHKLIVMATFGDASCHLLDSFILIQTHDMTLINSCSKLTMKESL